jgi:membrane protein implicated in regulation of membrane protease activity
MFPDLLTFAWLAWIVVVIAAIVLELLTLNLVFLMIAAGSLVGGLGAALLGLPWPLQIIAAAALSALLVFAIRPPLLKRLSRSSEAVRMNVDALTGMAATATVPFTGGGGFARLDNGETWTARLDPDHADAAVTPGAGLVVIAIHGATAVVTPVPTDADAPRSPRGGRP